MNWFWDISLLPIRIFFPLLIFGGIVVLLMQGARKSWRKKFREPFRTKILRPPGWGCLERRADALFDVAGLASALPIMWGTFSLTAYTTGWDDAWALILPLLLISVFMGYQIYRRIKRASTERMGFLGELAVAEELAALNNNDWQIFHDLPLERDGRKFNIDHIAVGPGVIVAIETKAYSKEREKKGGGDKALINNEVIELPSGSKKISLKQAKRQAASLRDWLREQGCRIDYVEPLVVIPGWTVTYKKDSSRQVRDPSNIVAWINALPKNEKFAEQQETICEVIDAQCRELRFDDLEE